MKKIAIILDSFSGLTKTEIEAKGFYFLPQLLIADGKTYTVGDTIKIEDMTPLLASGTKIETSQPNLGTLIDMFEDLSKKYDDVLFIPMHSKLSSTHSTAAAQAANYDNVSVVENTMTGLGFIHAAEQALKLYEETQDISKVMEYIKAYSKRTTTFVLPANIDRLIESGRLTGAKKYILKLGKLIPALYVNASGFKLDTLKRTFKGLVGHAVGASMKKLEIDESNIDDYIFEAHASLDQDIIDEAVNAYKAVGAKNIVITKLAPAVSAHVGKGLGILIYPKK